MATSSERRSLSKTLAIYVLMVVGGGGGLIAVAAALGFATIGREAPPEVVRPKWKAGEVVDVEITVVPTDQQNLACAAADEIAGKHCAFEAVNKPWSKGGDAGDDRKILKPYTATDRVQFITAGLWAELAKEKLPATRFSVKCKYTVDGTLKKVAVRWDPAGAWSPGGDWYAGAVSECKINP